MESQMFPPSKRSSAQQANRFDQALPVTRSLVLSLRDVVAENAESQVSGIDFWVDHGEAVALVGADRSTVVRLLTGDLQPRRGTISRLADGIGCHMLSLVGRAVDDLALDDIASTKPNVILVDEPFATLSKREADEMLTALLDCRDRRTSVIIATDRADVIERCCRVIEIEIDDSDRSTTNLGRLSGRAETLSC